MYETKAKVIVYYSILIMLCLVQAEQERLRETLKAQEEAIREAITKEKKDKESSKERFVLHSELEMWANAQRDGRPAEYRWRPLFNTAVWLTPTTRVPCINAAKTRNPLKLLGVPQTNETISATSGRKFTIL